MQSEKIKIYKIVDITDRQGNRKEEFLYKLAKAHPNMSGTILYPEFIKPGFCFCFAWKDNSEKVLKTSLLKEKADYGNRLVITTMNSIYTLEQIEE